MYEITSELKYERTTGGAKSDAFFRFRKSTANGDAIRNNNNGLNDIKSKASGDVSESDNTIVGISVRVHSERLKTPN